MNKCEHNERITNFCASECCVWKEAGGCEACIKKYHKHLGPTILVHEDEVTALLKKFTVDHAVKPKCRAVQEIIYDYLSQIKGELSTAIDASCKNIVNRIGYPFLDHNNLLSAYKRLKNKDYKKLQQV